MTVERFQWADFVGESKPEGSRTGAGDEPTILRSMLHSLFEEAPVGLFALDNRSGRFLHVNREFERITGYSREELLETSFTRVVAPEDVERVREHRRRRMRRDPTLPKRYEMLLMTRSGDRRAVLFDANPIHFTDVISGAVRDITKEKVFKDPVLHMQRLDGLASLASGLADEFNNLLSAIAGYSELALSSALPKSKVGLMLGKIQKAAQQALHHVRNLTAFSHSGSNAMESVNLSSLVESLANVLPSALPAKQFSFNSTVPPANCNVRGDVSQLEQALLNVTLNAIDSLPPTGGTISVGLERTEIVQVELGGLPLGRYSRLVITDDGHGIATADLERVLQPFFTTRPSPRHTGLGLSTAFGIIRDHGGSLSIQSDPECGTSVTILLPLDGTPGELVPAKLEGHLEEVSPHPTVLVVDDQEFVNELFRDVLEEDGYEVHCYTAATKALAAVQTATISPDLIIVDLMMPQMDGRAFIRQVREDGLRVPIIVTSGFSGAEDGDQSLRDETSGFLRKPFRPSKLRQIVANTLRPAGRPAKETP